MGLLTKLVVQSANSRFPQKNRAHLRIIMMTHPVIVVSSMHPYACVHLHDYTKRDAERGLGRQCKEKESLLFPTISIINLVAARSLIVVKLFPSLPAIRCYTRLTALFSLSFFLFFHSPPSIPVAPLSVNDLFPHCISLRNDTRHSKVKGSFFLLFQWEPSPLTTLYFAQLSSLLFVSLSFTTANTFSLFYLSSGSTYALDIEKHADVYPIVQLVALIIIRVLPAHRPLVCNVTRCFSTPWQYYRSTQQ